MARFISNLKLPMLGVLAAVLAGWILSGDVGWLAPWPAGRVVSPAALGFALAIVIDRTV